MRKPSIHLNGTGAERLLEQHEASLEALHRAITAVCDAGPNSRDYYVQGPDAPTEAQREHEARVARLKSVRDEIGQIVESLHDQVADRDLARRSR